MPISVSRRSLAIIAAVVAVALAVTLIVVLTRVSSERSVSLVAPATAADTVPKLRMPQKKDLPKGCGVQPETIKKYAPGADEESSRTHCDWYTMDRSGKRCGWCWSADGDLEQKLEVDSEAAASSSSAEHASKSGNALRALDEEPETTLQLAARPEDPGSQNRTVAGLGDEARYRFTPTTSMVAGATLRFRAGAAVVTVQYAGRDISDGRQRPVPEAVARRAVLAAATDVARALDIPAKPVFAEPRPGGAAPVRHVPRPCDLVSDPVTESVTPGATRSRGRPLVEGAGVAKPAPGLAIDTCRWDSEPTCCLHKDTDDRPERHLSVTVRSVNERRRAAYVPDAARYFLEEYYDAREGSGLSGFRPVRGLGAQAHAVYWNEEDTVQNPHGMVAFRYRNLVIQVRYSAGDDERLPQDLAIKGAYTAAVHARAALPA